MDQITLSLDVLGNVFSLLDTENMVKAMKVCKRWKEAFDRDIRRYKLSFNFCKNKITDDNLELFRGAKYVDLSGCKYITNNGLKNLQLSDGSLGVYEIKLGNCNNITDEGLQYISGAKIVSLASCKQIKGSGFKHLMGLEEIVLTHCNNLNNIYMKYLKEVKRIIFSYCASITDEGLEYLKSDDENHYFEKIALNHCCITDDGLKYLKGAKMVNLMWCYNVTDRGLEHIKGVELANLLACPGITRRGVDMLKEANPNANIISSVS